MNLLMLAALLQQEMTAQDVVDKMEARVSAVQDISLTFDGDKIGTMFSPVRYLRPATVKIRRDGHAVFETALADDWLIDSGIDIRIAQTPETLAARLIPFREDGRPELLPPAFLHVRSKLDLSTTDLWITPNALPLRMFYDEPILYYQFAPKRFFSLEKNLRVLERRKVEGRETVILGSRAQAQDPVRAMGIPLVNAATVEKRFYVDTETWLLERIILRFDLGRNVYGGVIVSRVVERTETKLGVPIPSRTEVTIDTIQRNRWSIAKAKPRVIRLVAVNSGLKAEEFDLPALEVEGDAVLRPPAKAPQGAAAHYDNAMARLWIRRVAGKLTGQGSGTEEAHAVADLEKAVAAAPKSEMLARNLLAAYAMFDAPKAVPFFEKGAGSSKEWKEHGATLYLRDGKPEMAAALVGADSPVSIDIELARSKGAEAAAAMARFPEAKILSSRLAAHWDLMLPELLKNFRNPKLAAIACRSARPEDRGKLVKAALEQFPKDALVSAEVAGWIVEAAVADLDLGWVAERMSDGIDRDVIAAVAAVRIKKDAGIEKVLRTIEKDGSSAAHFLALELRATDRESAGRACAAYFRWASKQEDSVFWRFYGGTVASPFVVAVGLFKDGWGPIDLVRCLMPAVGGGAGRSIGWLVQDALRQNGLADNMESFVDACAAYAAKNPSDAVALETAARFLYWTAGNNAAVKLLDKALAAGIEHPRVRTARSLYSGKLEPVEAYAKFFEEARLPAAERLEHLRTAIRSAIAAGDLAAAAGLLGTLSWKEIPRDPGVLTDLAQGAIEAKSYAKARELAAEILDLGAQPYVLLGQVEEAQENYEGAVRWYNLDIREIGDPLRIDDGRRTVTGSDAKKALLKRIGEDYFLKKLLEAKREPLAKEEERKLRDAVDGLLAQEIDARERAEEDLRVFGPRAVPVLKDALDGADEEARARLLKILNDWAEPK